MGQLARVFGNSLLGCIGQVGPLVPFMQERTGHRRVTDWCCKDPSFSEKGLLVTKEKRQGHIDSYFWRHPDVWSHQYLAPIFNYGGSQKLLKGYEEKDKFLPWLKASGLPSDEPQAQKPASHATFLWVLCWWFTMSVQPWGITRAGQKSHRLDQQKVGEPLHCTYQIPGQGTFLESDRWPSNAPSHSNTASWCTGQGGPQHSGPRSEQRNMSQSAGLQRGREEGDTFRGGHHRTLGQVPGACSHWCFFLLSIILIWSSILPHPPRSWCSPAPSPGAQQGCRRQASPSSIRSHIPI